MLGAPTIFVGAPSKSSERAKMSLTLSYKNQIVTRLYESLFTFFFLCFPSSFLGSWPWPCRDHAAVIVTMHFAVAVVCGAFMLLLLSWLWSCSVVAASSFFFSFEVSYPCSFVVTVCGCYCLFSLLIAFFLVFTVFVFFFIGVFFVFMCLFCENETYRLTIHMVYTDCWSIWIIQITNSYDPYRSKIRINHTNCQSV